MMWTAPGISFLDGWPFPFSLEWLDLYPARGVWFPSRLLQEGTDGV
jgi:hypothetical protein